MGYTIPNANDAAYSAQADPDSMDLAIIAAGVGGTGVLTGGQVTSAIAPSMVLTIAAGTAMLSDTLLVTITGGTITVPSNTSANARFDLIVVDGLGTNRLILGTPSVVPSFPGVPLDNEGKFLVITLASVYVPASATSITPGQIVDKRILLYENRVPGWAVNRIPSLSFTLPVSSSLMPSSSYEIPNGVFIELANDAVLEIA